MKAIKSCVSVAALAGAMTFGSTAYGAAPTTFLDKVTCTGAQYVDTGLLPDKNLRAVVTLSTTDTSHDKMVFGKRHEGFYFLCWFGTSAGTSIAPCIGNSGNLSGKSTGKAAGEKWTLDFSANGISADETEVFSASTLSGYIKDTTSAKTLLLFGLSNNGSVDSRKFYGDCYRAKFYSGEKLVRDLVPCLDAEGAACFYNLAYDSADAATGNEYYYSATATAFVAGEVVVPVVDASASYAYSSGNINVSFACKRVSTSVCKTIKAVVKDSVSSSEVILAEDVATVEGVTKSIPVDLAKAPFDVSIVYQSSDAQTLDTLVLGTNITIEAVSVTATQASLTALGDVGEFVISLPDGVTKDNDVEVNYSMGGMAVNGTDYVTLSGKATIPAGEESVTVMIRQSSNCGATAVKDVTITLQPGVYVVGSPATATLSKKFYKHNVAKNVLDFTVNCDSDGNNAVSSSSAAVTTKDSVTIAVWAKLDEENMPLTDYRYPYGPIFMQTGSAKDYMFTYLRGKKQLMFMRSNDWNATDDMKTIVDAPASGEWHFLTAVYDRDAQTRAIYIDGVLAGQDSDARDFAPNQVAVGFGYTPYGNFLRGALAEMSVWQKALSASEIATLMWNRPTDLTDCLAYWPLDDGDGASTARDLVAGNTLTIRLPTKSILQENADFVDFQVGDSRIKFGVDVKYPTNGVSVAVSGTEMVDGKFVKDSQGTFTASSATGSFVGWAGDVPDALRANPSLTMTIDADKIISPVFAYDWIYDAAAKTITDGYWTLNVTASETALTISGVNSATYINAQNKPLIPLLDLRKGIADTNEVAYSIVQINSGVFVDNPVLAEVRLPDSLKYMKGTWGNDSGRGPFANCTSLATVTPLVPAGLVEFGISTFAGCSKLAGELVFGAAEGAYFVNGEWHGNQLQSTKITSVTLDKKIDVLPIGIFNGCTAIKTFSLEHRPATIKGDAFKGWSAYQCRFLIDSTDSGWYDYMTYATNYTAWSALDETIKAKYTAAFPNEKKPLGLSLTTPANQWLCNIRPLGLTVIVR